MHASRQTRHYQTLLAQPVRESYQGVRFCNRSELLVAQYLTHIGVMWEYEPRTFVLEYNEEGRPCEAFTPDFYLPETNQYIEVTAMKQSLVTRKNRKQRKAKARFPDVKIGIFYRRDLWYLVLEARSRGMFIEKPLYKEARRQLANEAHTSAEAQRIPLYRLAAA